MSPAPIITTAPAIATSFAEPFGGSGVERSCASQLNAIVEAARMASTRPRLPEINDIGTTFCFLEGEPDAREYPVLAVVCEKNIDAVRGIEKSNPETRTSRLVPASRRL